MRLTPCLALLLALPTDAAAGTLYHQVMAGGYLGVTPGARRPITVGAELGAGLSPGYNAPVDFEAVVRGELRAGRIGQLGLGVRTVLGSHSTGWRGYGRQAGVGLLAGVALRGDGRSGGLFGVSAIANTGTTSEGRVTLDVVAPFSGPAPRVPAPAMPRGVEDGPNPRAYKLRGGAGPRVTSLIEPTLSLSMHGYALFPYEAFVGRPCRDGEGGTTLARVWVAGEPTPEAERWIERGREEAASVGVFVQLARDLAALGAPEHLAHRALAAADEEVAHALLSYAMAERICPGIRVFPADWPSPAPLVGTRSQRLVQLALESLLDGIGAETEAAKLSRTLRDAATDSVEATVEDRIAREEAGHAALAEDVVVWAAAEGGSKVCRALRVA